MAAVRAAKASSSTSRVEMPGLQQKLILSAAPRADGVQFWRLVEEEEVAVVVMLCEVGADYDCCQYFPPSPLHPAMEQGELRVETAREGETRQALPADLMLEYLELRPGDLRGSG